MCFTAGRNRLGCSSSRVVVYNKQELMIILCMLFLKQAIQTMYLTLSGLSILSGFPHRDNTVYIAYSYLVGMVHIVPKSSLISVTIMELFRSAFFRKQLKFFNQSIWLSINPISISMLWQSIPPHAPGARTPTNLNSSQHSYQSVDRHPGKLLFVRSSDRIN